MKFGNGLSTNNTQCWLSKQVWAMREIGNDELSALMDGEATELEMHRVLRSIEEDPAQAAKWQRYHLASAILKKEIRPGSGEQMLKLDLASRISAAIAEEPVLSQSSDPELATRVPATKSPAWWKPMANVAIAASVATAVVIGWQQTQPGVTTPTLPLTAHAPQNAPVMAATPVASNAMTTQTAMTTPNVMNAQNAISAQNAMSAQNVMPVQFGNTVPASPSYGVMPRSVAVPVEYLRPQKLDEQRFNHYLISHSGNAAFATQGGGQLPYVRVVTLKPVEAQR